MNILTVGYLQALELTALEAQFGRYGTRLYELARGIDHNKENLPKCIRASHAVVFRRSSLR